MTLKRTYISRKREGKHVDEHVLVAERALGKRLPPGAEVHHVDFDKRNNAPANLVICPDSAYHKLLHIRQRAMNACGNPNWRKCKFCKQHDDPARMTMQQNYGKDGRPYSGDYWHPECKNVYQRAQRSAK